MGHLLREHKAQALAVGRGQGEGGAAEAEPAPLQDGHAVTQRLRLVQVMGGEDDRATCGPREAA